jgi:hypothetical protein
VFGKRIAYDTLFGAVFGESRVRLGFVIIVLLYLQVCSVQRALSLELELEFWTAIEHE